MYTITLTNEEYATLCNIINQSNNDELKQAINAAKFDNCKTNLHDLLYNHHDIL